MAAYAAPVLLTSTTVLFEQPTGGFLASSSGVTGEQAVTVPVTDLLYWDELDLLGNETVSDYQALTQDVYHILLESPSSNLDDPDRGLWIEGYLNGSLTDLLVVPGIVDSMLRKDTRIDGSTTTLTTVDAAASSYLLNILIEVDGSVVPLSYSYTPQTGLVPS